MPWDCRVLEDLRALSSVSRSPLGDYGPIAELMDFTESNYNSSARWKWLILVGAALLLQLKVKCILSVMFRYSSSVALSIQLNFCSDVVDPAASLNTRVIPGIHKIFFSAHLFYIFLQVVVLFCVVMLLFWCRKHCVLMHYMHYFQSINTNYNHIFNHLRI